MKTKTLVCSGFLILAIGCSSSGSSNYSTDNGLPLPNYQKALEACMDSKLKCSMLQPTNTECPKIRADLVAPEGGAFGKSSTCADAQAAVVITCLLPSCTSPSMEADVKNCENGYLNQIKAICQ